MRHSRLQKLLARRQELSEREQAALRMHLLACGECRAREAEYASQDDVLRSMSHDQPFVTARSRILHVAESRGSRPANSRRLPAFAILLSPQS